MLSLLSHNLHALPTFRPITHRMNPVYRNFNLKFVCWKIEIQSLNRFVFSNRLHKKPLCPREAELVRNSH